MAKNYWLFKSEPNEFSIDDLKRVKREAWNGVRNYQARNFMRDQMQIGDELLFYHSSCPRPGVVGVAKIVKTAYPDPSAWDKKSAYYDAKSSPENPRWLMVDVGFVEKFERVIELKELRENPKLKEMLILRKGNRLSITPLKKSEFEVIKKMA